MRITTTFSIIIISNCFIWEASHFWRWNFANKLTLIAENLAVRWPPILITPAGHNSWHKSLCQTYVGCIDSSSHFNTENQCPTLTTLVIPPACVRVAVWCFYLQCDANCILKFYCMTITVDLLRGLSIMKNLQICSSGQYSKLGEFATLTTFAHLLVITYIWLILQISRIRGPVNYPYVLLCNGCLREEMQMCQKLNDFYIYYFLCYTTIYLYWQGLLVMFWKLCLLQYDRGQSDILGGSYQGSPVWQTGLIYCLANQLQLCTSKVSLSGRYLANMMNKII